MTELELKYGRDERRIHFDEMRFEVLKPPGAAPSLSDIEIGRRLDSPIDSPPLEDIVKPGETVLIVVPDATREAAAGQIVNLIVRRLIANGTQPFDIAIIFATGIHRAVSAEEKENILTPFVAQRIKTLDHRPRDLMQIEQYGETASGIRVGLNRVLKEYDRVVTVGSVSFHYFAGFTGGRKLICPGLASSATIAATHKLAFDSETKDRRRGVGTALLDGNAVHEAFMEVAATAAPDLSINTIVNERGEAVEVFCGNWITSHRRACEYFDAANTINIKEKREVVVVSCGGYPSDINLIQAHKTLDAAAEACIPGGMILLFAECEEGLGRRDLEEWFDGDSDAIAEKLCKNYKVNGQTAWSILKKAEKFDIKMAAALSDSHLEMIGIERMTDPDKFLSEKSGYIIPNGAKLRFSAAA
jgi:nickel-dependent lactate racemase